MAFDYAITLNDPLRLGGTSDDLLVTDLSAALADWSSHLSGLGVLTVQLSIVVPDIAIGNGRELAGARPGGSLIVGTAPNGIVIRQPASEHLFLTGQHLPGTGSDIEIEVPLPALSTLYLNPDPSAGTAVPARQYDAVSVFRHELEHGFGMSGFLASDSTAATPRSVESQYDAQILQQPDGSAYFVGTRAMAAYGGPVPLTTVNGVENLYHLANAKSDPLGDDLMNGLGLRPGVSVGISAVDLAILQDVGQPVTSGGYTPAPYAIAAANGSQTTGAPGTTTSFTFTVTRHGDLSAARTLGYAVSGLSTGAGVIAAGADDFGSAYPNGSVGFAAGAGTASITVAVPGTAVLKPSEGFAVTLATPAGAVAATATIGNAVPSSSPLGVARDAAGTATIALQGRHDQYVVTPAGNDSVSVADTLPGRDGAQTVQDAGNIAFADGVGVFDPTGNAEAVTHLYEAAFGGQPDLAGLDYWTAQVNAGTLGLTDVATAFLAAPRDAGAGLVQSLYGDILHRPAEAAGLDYWNGLLSSGTSAASVLASFADSTETIGATLSVAGDTQYAEMTRLYRAAFGRTPDAAGAAYWTGLLKEGTSPSSVAAAFAGTAEFAPTAGTPDNGVYVTKLYNNVLGRDADGAGAGYWAGQLNAGASRSAVLLGFADSAENRAHTAAATHDGWVYLPYA